MMNSGASSVETAALSMDCSLGGHYAGDRVDHRARVQHGVHDAVSQDHRRRRLHRLLGVAG